VRLGFAIAAHLEPEILVVDEVLAVGDAEFQKKAIGKMQDVSKGEGRTVLFVSHNMSAVKSLCSTGIVLNNGSISFAGTAEASINEYLKRSLSKNNDLIQFAKYSSSKLIVEEVLVNDSSYNHVKMNSEKTELRISIKGQVIEPTQFVLEAIIFDNNEVPVAVYSPTHISNIIPRYKTGKFTLSEIINIPPNLNSGDYFVDIYLNNPMIEGHVSFNKSLQIEKEGIPTKSGFLFDYSKGYGYLSL